MRLLTGHLLPLLYTLSLTTTSKLDYYSRFAPNSSAWRAPHLIVSLDYRAGSLTGLDIEIFHPHSYNNMKSVFGHSLQRFVG